MWPMIVTTTQAWFDRVIHPGTVQPIAAEFRRNGQIIATTPKLLIVS